MRSSVVIGFVLAAVCASRTAEAKCGDPFCRQIYRHVQPGHGEVIPENAAALEFLLVPLDAGLTIEKSDGGVVGYSVGADARGLPILHPDELVAGENYVARSPPVGCVLGDAGEFVETYSVTGAAPAATELGTVTIGPVEDVLVDVTGGAGGDACLMDAPGKRVRFQISPSASLTPWLPLTNWEVAVDGQLRPLVQTGGLLADGGLVPYLDPPFDDLSEPLAVTLLCGESARRVQVIARIVGVDVPLASDVMTVDLSCDQPGDGGPTPLSGTPPLKDAPPCGCSSVGAVPLLLLAGLAAIRRRRLS